MNMAENQERRKQQKDQNSDDITDDISFCGRAKTLSTVHIEAYKLHLVSELLN